MTSRSSCYIVQLRNFDKWADIYSSDGYENALSVYRKYQDALDHHKYRIVYQQLFIEVLIGDDEDEPW